MPRTPVSTPPTLSQLREHQCWIWLHCPKWACLHHAPIALTPAIILWGPDASSDMLRERTRCSRCGNRGGVTLKVPSWAGQGVGLAPFPL
jgi:hypothetical protein